jgi:hypothetical protein
MAPSYVVRVSVSRGLGPEEKEAELPLLGNSPVNTAVDSGSGVGQMSMT